MVTPKSSGRSTAARIVEIESNARPESRITVRLVQCCSVEIARGVAGYSVVDRLTQLVARSSSVLHPNSKADVLARILDRLRHGHVESVWLKEKRRIDGIDSCSAAGDVRSRTWRNDISGWATGMRQRLPAYRTLTQYHLHE